MESTSREYVGNLRSQSDEQSYVDVYPPRGTAPSRSITDGITWPIGTAVDAENTLYVTNGTKANGQCGDIAEYRAGRSHAFQSITDEMNSPIALTFDKSGRFYVANGGIAGCDNGPYPTVLEFLYGSVTPTKRTITLHGGPDGIAYYPPQVP
jgi:hypothetical protein